MIGLSGHACFPLSVDDLYDDASETRLVGPATNAFYEAYMGSAYSPGIGIRGFKTATKVGVAEFQQTAGFVRGHIRAYATEVTWVS